MPDIKATLLGQSGLRLMFGEDVVYFDPYLTDEVACLDGPDLHRMIPVPVPPEQVKDARWIFISHIHLDHCDLATIRPVMEASPQSVLVGPNVVMRHLRESGIAADRLKVGDQGPIRIGEHTVVHAVPACHPSIERDDAGHLKCVGYVVENEGRRIYHAGDTSPHEDVASAVRRSGPVDVAFLPVNERNYYRERRGIIGNMSVREAFQFAEELGVKTIVPIHWDMFRPNSVFREEIELLYRLLAPKFEMKIYPSVI